MISLFLVEDEKTSRESIRDNIDWNSFGVTLIGDAPDGEIALPQILANPPDILLTDIKMPFMDGLELAEIVSKKLPETKIIIISGFDDFAYAKQAISLGVTEYILKPASPEDITTAVKKAGDLVVAKRSNKELQTTKDAEHQILKEETLFKDLLRPGIPLPTLLEKADSLGIELQAGYYKVLILEQAQQQSYDRKEIILNPNIFSTQNGNHSAYILKGESDEEINALEQLFVTLTLQKVPLKTGSLVTRITDIYSSYLNAFFEENADMEEVSRAIAEKNIRAEMERFLKLGTVAEVGLFWERHNEIIQAGAKSMIFAGYLYAELFIALRTVANELGITIDKETYSPAILEKGVLNGSSPSDFIDYAKKAFYNFLEVRNASGKLGCSPMEIDATEYIKHNYANEELSLNMIAAHVGVSPNYLSTVFKVKTGKNIFEYVTEVRIEHAKELLEKSVLKTYEIGLRVGYNSISHFSTTFKKEVGVSPSNYRKIKLRT